jgi:hypothetical protein
MEKLRLIFKIKNRAFRSVTSFGGHLELSRRLGVLELENKF